MNIEQLLTDAVVKAVKACYGADITPEQVQIQKTRPDFEGAPHCGHLPLPAHLQA